MPLVNASATAWASGARGRARYQLLAATWHLGDVTTADRVAAVIAGKAVARVARGRGLHWQPFTPSAEEMHAALHRRIAFASPGNSSARTLKVGADLDKRLRCFERSTPGTTWGPGVARSPEAAPGHDHGRTFA